MGLLALDANIVCTTPLDIAVHPLGFDSSVPYAQRPKSKPHALRVTLTCDSRIGDRPSWQGSRSPERRRHGLDGRARLRRLRRRSGACPPLPWPPPGRPLWPPPCGRPPGRPAAGAIIWYHLKLSSRVQWLINSNAHARKTRRTLMSSAQTYPAQIYIAHTEVLGLWGVRLKAESCS